MQFVFPTIDLKRYSFPTHINDIVIDRADSGFSEVFVVLIKAGEATLHHRHDDTEQVFYIIEGSGVLSAGEDKKEYPVRPGDVVRIPVSMLHSVRAGKAQTLKYLCIDCFGKKPVDEPTWADHVKVVCEANGWDFDKVAGVR
jgi:mannose-6-phosphate isomerase-like protein (cupin superfamily)